MAYRWLLASALVMGWAGTASAGNAKAKAAKPATKVEAPPPVEETPPVEEAPPQEEDPFATIPHLTGPKLVDLGHDAELELPAGMILLERTAAADLMKKWGNSTEGVIAAIFPPRGTADWTIVIEAADIGYISDDDADELDPKPLMESITKGTLEQNKERKRIGVPELFIDGWSEVPRYERAQHQLVWGINAHATDGKIVDFYTRVLGRNGMLAVNLIDAPEKIEASKKGTLVVLGALRFRPGARYTDHVSGDRDSGIGLRALVLGGAGLVLAKKGGLLIALLLFLKKAFVFIAAGIAGFFKWMFGRKKKDAGTTPPSEPPPAPPTPPGSAPAG